MKKLLFVVGVVGAVCWSGTAFAWDYTCSPKETKDLSQQTPNVLLMLDRSGSMDDADGVINNTCKVCQSSAGFYYEVDSAAGCPTTGLDWTRTASDSSSAPSSGYSWNLNVATPVATTDMQLLVDIDGDFDSVCEWGDVFVDGTYVGRIDSSNLTANSNGCSDDEYAPFRFTIPQALASDGNLVIDVVTSPDNNDCDGNVGPGNCHLLGVCDGVDDCGSSADNAISVTVAHGNTYLGTQTWADPCGAPDKWEQAKDAIDALTAQSDGASPPYANFGLGLYYNDTTARIEHGCQTPSNASITSTLNSTGPGGSTPTARAIMTSYQSSCVVPAPTITRTQSGNYPTDTTNRGWDLSFNFANVPTEFVELDVTVDGDFGGTCEFAAVYVDGTYVGQVGAVDCGSSTLSVTLPASMAADGELDVFVDTRAQADATTLPLPVCTPGTDGVEASCSGANGAIVSITHSNNSPPAGATILINDGQPTRQLDGSSGNAAAADDAVVQACAHRARAPMFVVGLGAGTDVEFNHVLAAAGGTGSCAGDADPCDDPTNWETLDGSCDGAFQAESRDALLVALEAITAQLSCTFNINFFNSGYTEVPTDPTGAYAYLAVDVLNAYTGQTQKVCHRDHPDTAGPGATCIIDPSDPDCACDDPVAGEGWEFTNASNQFIQFTGHYCDQVRSYVYEEGSTQLACLCQETPGGACSVPDHDALGVCPDGNWICIEGVDICDPEPECCEAGAACDTGLLGVCGPGQIVCDGPAMGTCVPLQDPSPEICDNLDNDCDGEIDEELGGDDCVVVGGIGRCGRGTIECRNGNLTCEPLGPQRELCNGLDDDCNGMTDDLQRSWTRPDSHFPADNPTYQSAEPDEAAAACGFVDVCVCRDGASAVYEGKDWDDYMASYYPPVCECGEGLTPDERVEVQSPGPPSPGPTDDANACGTTSAQEADGVGGLLVLALVALGRRRRRRADGV